jgi:O-antigen ligase
MQSQLATLVRYETLRARPPFASRLSGACENCEYALASAVFGALQLLALAPVRWLLLTVVVLDIPLQMETHLRYNADAAALGALGGLNISATTIALVGLYLGWLFAGGSRETEKKPGILCNLPLLLYVANAVLSIVVARSVSLASFEVILFLQMLALYTYLVNTVTTRTEVRYLIALLLFGLFAEGMFMVYMGYTGSAPQIWGLKARLDEAKSVGSLDRVAGTIGSANTAAAYLSTMLAFAACVLASKYDRGMKLLAALSVLAGLVALVLTYSRGGWTALAVAAAAFCWWGRKRKRSWVVVTALVLAIVIALVAFASTIAARITEDDRGSAYSRVPLMKLAFRIIADHPLLGIGSNNFGIVMKNYENSDFRSGFLYAVHNQYLLVWAETGIGGLIALLWFYIGTIRSGRICWARHDEFLSPLALGISAGLLGYMVQMSVDIFRDRPMMQLVCTLSALVTISSRLIDKSQEQPGTGDDQAEFAHAASA